MNKNLTLRVALVASLLLGAVSSAFAALTGAGSVADPYLIGTSADLVEFATTLGATKCYKLTADIDMAETEYPVPTVGFKGTFDGGNFVISNLTINTATTQNYVGFIPNVNGACTVKNLGLKNFTITAPGSAKMIGGLIGVCANAGLVTIENCFVEGVVNGAGANSNDANGVGAFIGKINNKSGQALKVKNCYADVVVSSKLKSLNAGLVGQQTKNGVVTVENYVFYGTAADPIINKTVGNPNLTNAYYVQDSEQNTQSATLLSDPTAEASYAGFDFTNTWVMKDGKAKLLSFEGPALPVVAPTDSASITYMNLGSVDNSNNVDSFYNTQEITLQAPTGDSTGCAFAGWYVDAALNIPVASPAIAMETTEDQVFYAKWVSRFEINSLKWAANDTINDLSVITGSKAIINVNYSGTALASDSLYLLISSKPDYQKKNNASIYWVAEKIGFPAGETQVAVEFDVKAFTPNNADANKFRAFLSTSNSIGWEARYDLGVEGAAGDAIYGNITTGTATDTFTISYMNIGTIDNSNNRAEFTDIQTFALQAPTGAKDSTGFMFDGWYADAALTVPVGRPAIAFGTKNDTTFYAKWNEVISSVITYENIGAVDNSNNVDTFNNFESVTLQAPAGDTIGYTFAGWFADSALTIPVGTPAVAVGTTDDTTFYAKWEVFVQPFVVSSLEWASNEALSTIPVEANSQVSVNISYLGTPSSDSLYFMVSSKNAWDQYWFVEKIMFPADTNMVSVDFTVRDFTGNVNVDKFRVHLGATMDATWTTRYDIADDNASGNDGIFGTITAMVPTDSSMITYENIGAVDNSNNVDSFNNTQIITLQTPVGDSLGYVFMGWYADDSLAIPVNVPAISRGTTNDTTFYAKWIERIESTITYKNIGAVDNSNNPTTFINVDAVTLQAPAGDSTGYVFVGWYADSALTTPIGTPAINVGTTNDTVFYAKWDIPFVISSLSWENAGGGDLQVEENGNAAVSVFYEGYTQDSLYLLISSKPDYNTRKNASIYWVSEKIGFPVEQDSLTVEFNVKAFNAANADQNKFRVMLSSSNNEGWPLRYDIAADSLSNNDAIYGTILPSSAGFSDEKVEDLNVYPNPTDGVFTISLEQEAMMYIYTMNGMLVYTSPAVAGDNIVDLSSQTRGIYILKIKDEMSYQVAPVILR